jgi:EAL domain-containing protein (putative c-di-GMP-specific phosphodiesterase class I)/ActR/RegA family two-component response regulator
MKQEIVVIDDDLDVSNLVKDVAEARGIACTTTADAASFMGALTPETTLIFLDLIIPGVDGVEILRQLAGKHCSAGIVLMSGIGKRVIESASTLGQSLGLDIVGNLAKPFRIAELETLLDGQIQHSPPLILKPGKDIEFEEAELSWAVTRDEFVLHYQPQIEIATGDIVGLEGLVRWEHPKHGLIFPDNFIENVEDLGLIDPLTFLVVRHGLSEIGLFTPMFPHQLTLSLNVSPTSLLDIDFTNRFIAVVNSHHFRPEDIILEITESGLIRELSRTLDVLTRLRMKGVQLSIDDFGIGYSMMQQIRNVPATEIKIDKSITQAIQIEADRVIIQKTIELGHELGMKVVAEGVETYEQLDFLASQGCDIAQGYLFSKPLPSMRLMEWLVNYRPHAPRKLAEG